MENKKKVLVFIDWFLPAYKAGGPIQSVFNLVTRLSGKVDFYIVTSDRDCNDEKAFEGKQFNTWTSIKGVNVMYLDSDHQNGSFIKNVIEENDFDHVYLNSMFSIKFAIIPMLKSIKLNKSVVLAPRGMLGEGALKFGRYKKKLFLFLFKLFNLHSKITWQATAVEEKQEIESHFGNDLNIFIAPNLGKNVNERMLKAKKDVGHVNLFFLSRISTKKNLLGALGFLRSVNEDYRIDFDVIGPIEDKSYWVECEELITQLPENVKVTYKGAFPNHELPDLLKNYHFMLLPTFNENFGHVIMEAWQNGCPVIISDQTPWKNLESKRIGWDLPLSNPEFFIESIEKCSLMDNQSYSEWSNASFQFAKSFHENPDTLNASKRLFDLLPL